MAMKRPGIYVGLSAYYFDDTAIMDAGEDAELLYVRMLAYAARQMEYEGFISDQVILSRLGILPRESGNGTGNVPGPDAASRAGRLAGVGLLTREEGGYRISGWLKWNKSAAEMGKERARDRERKQDPDKGISSNRTGSAPGNDTGTDAGTGAGVRRQRPDQTRPDHMQTNLSPAADAPSKRVDEEFAEWYATYPRKTARGRALTAYRTARKKTDAATLLAALVAQTPQLTAKGTEFVPYPATWLNGERWLDEAPAPAASSPDDYDDWEEPEEDRAAYEAYDAQMRALEEANR